MTKVYDQLLDTAEEILKLKARSDAELCEPIAEGKWSIREIIGHMYYWDKFNLEKMIPLMEDQADLPKFPDHDEYNEEALAYLENESVESIISLFVDTRKKLVENVSSVDKDVRFTLGGGKRKFSGESFIKMFLKHDQHHLKQIREKL